MAPNMSGSRPWRYPRQLAVMVTALNPTVERAVELWEVEAAPASSEPDRLASVTMEPGTAVHVVPSDEVAAA